MKFGAGALTRRESSHPAPCGVKPDTKSPLRRAALHFGNALYVQRDAVPVHRAPREGLQDQEIQCSRQNIAFGLTHAVLRARASFS